jgi:hypothetical protein
LADPRGIILLVDNPNTTAAAKRLALALEMFDTGVDMMRQKFIRQNPKLSANEIESLLETWLGQRPGAEFGDAIGRSGDLSRFSEPRP